MKTQLPEKFEGYTSGVRSEAHLLLAFNQLIDYLKEREEITEAIPTYAGYSVGDSDVIIPPEPEWKVGDTYFGIYDTGRVYESVWDDDTIDHDRRDFLGIYRTKEEAEAVLVKVKAVVKN